MSPHAALISASGLRPMSAFVVVGSVVLSVAVWVARLAAHAAEQPDRIRSDEGERPAYAIAARDGRTIARFAPRFDLVLSPRSLWQAHTPRHMAEALSGRLGGVPSAEELLARLLPDADARGEIHVRGWDFNRRQTQRLHAWIESGAGSELGRLEGIRYEEAGPGAWRLVWQPAVLLSKEVREAHGVSAAWRWARRIADGLDACRRDVPLDGRLLSDAQARALRDGVWRKLIPSAFARPVTGVAPDLVLSLRECLEEEGVADWQMEIDYGRDRVYPAGAQELFGSWGFPDAAAKDPEPRSGLELLCDGLFDSRRFAFLERRGDLYRWIDDRPVRGERANGYLDFTPASPAPVVRTTLDLGLQRFLGAALEDALRENEAAVAMGIVLDVQSGAVLALDAREEYPIAPFAPVFHVFTTGSTFKAITMAVALEEGVVRESEIFDVGHGEYRVHYPDGRASYRVIKEAENALGGSQTVADFFAHSVNAAMAKVALRVPDAVFHGYLERLHYGTKPGSGLGPERAGHLPSLPWSYASTHASIGFGHEFSTTLWRHAEGLATIVRGGEYRPLTLLSSVEQEERVIPVPAALPERVFSAETCARVRDLMRLGAREGTGKKARAAFEQSLAARFPEGVTPEQWDLGTKTGTAQKVPTELCVHVELGERERWEAQGIPATRARVAGLRSIAKPHRNCYTSSICVFGRGPLDTRDIMVFIVIDEPRGRVKYGSDVAGPTAQRVLAEALGLTANGAAPSPDVAPGFAASSLVALAGGRSAP